MIWSKLYDYSTEGYACASTQNTHIGISASTTLSIQSNILYISVHLKAHPKARTHLQQQNIHTHRFTFETYCNYILFDVQHFLRSVFVRILRASTIIFKLVEICISFVQTSFLSSLSFGDGLPHLNIIHVHLKSRHVR